MTSSAPFSTFMFLLLAIATIIPLANAAFINFENCLEPGIRTSRKLQFRPYYFWAHFNTTAPSHHLNITIYGNVTGSETVDDYPPPEDGSWRDPNSTFGKIVDISPSNPTPKYTTLFSNYRVLTYTAYQAQPAPFCQSTVNASCPIGPAFDGDREDPYSLRSFAVGHDFFSSYSFATLATTIRVDSGDADAHHLACVSANITPDLGSKLSNTLRYLPAAVLALVAMATILAAICSPWGTSDPFRWSSNYGRDEDLIRLVTPGFGDCLQYIQFIVLAGSLNLAYPGFYQPVVSQASWSLLLFNESVVSHGDGSHSLVDGIYFTNGTYGLSRLGQLVGMSEEKDIWAGMAVWLLGIIVAVVLLSYLMFFVRWVYRTASHIQESDHTRKNWPFTMGNIIRMLYNFFLLPIITLSLFQLVVASHSPASVVVTAVIMLLGVIAFAIWIFWFIFTTRPRAHLFDDLPTVLTYGPLYNTYSDGAAPFAFIPVLLTCVRGIAIGAIQPSGVAQLVILAICEVILILTLHAFRPFQSNTSMNAYHTFFSAVRLTTTLLMIAFVPSLGVSEEPKGWIGYTVLLLHAAVLVFGFFLNSLQTFIEVAARLAGAGGDTRGGLSTVFGMRQLAKRTHSHRRGQRSSLNSNAAMLAVEEPKAAGRARSLSGSSAVLLNQHLPGSHRGSMGFDQYSQGGDYSNYSGTSPGTPSGASPFTYLPSGGSGPSSRRPTMGTTMESVDVYYRPPRPRKTTMESQIPGLLNRESKGSSDLANTPYADTIDQAETGDAGEGPSSMSPSKSSITPAYLRMHRDDSDPTLSERRKNTDYTVRESDFYYGIRGPTLSAQPSRKLKTGPADPMGPAASAAGFFKSLFGPKRKEKSKGFEVVRSTRMPPQMVPLDEDEESPEIPPEPYKDNPGSPSDAQKSPNRNIAGAPGGVDRADVLQSSDSGSDERESILGSRVSSIRRLPDDAPILGPIETGGGIELPSRIGSRASRAGQPQPLTRVPTIPRKSSKRPKSTEKAVLDSSSRLSTVVASPPDTPGAMSPPRPVSRQNLMPHPTGFPAHLPFGSSEPSPSPERSPGQSTTSSLFRHDGMQELHPMGEADVLVPPQIVDAGTGRPLSTGYVSQHRAHESIHDFRDSGSHLEASAEIVDARTRSMGSMGSGVSNVSNRSRQ
ncbi:hypothetical protein GQ43DRAFT_434861 [Delitschia confertaspora ATCC 74209]|uniref:ML-like domain-containing protein n=1 Tax=Delitschia confertaspora ATCC 74209 TaxID=1513339 RepID=A0A9P4JE53_9PLEO|nr:hypothetical protein GQ43DRAFT_434861 [Delitschia confertaspora ATCC 74209]